MSIDSKVYEFTKQNVDNAPDDAGVYELLDGKTTIYFGRAKGGTTTIRSRLQSHFSGNEGKCTQAATSYRREVCTNPVSREKELLDEYEKAHRQLPRCNEKRA